MARMPGPTEKTLTKPPRRPKMRKLVLMLLATAWVVTMSPLTTFGTQSPEPVAVETGEPAPFAGVLATQEDWSLLLADQANLEDEVAALREALEARKTEVAALRSETFDLKLKIAAAEEAGQYMGDIAEIQMALTASCNREKILAFVATAACLTFK